jgi:ABC-2 type transport system permease protein
MPLMFAMLIPYMRPCFVDIRTLTLPLRIHVYIIPFSHTFMASSSMIFDDYVFTSAGLPTRSSSWWLSCSWPSSLLGRPDLHHRLNFGKKRHKGLPNE